MIPREAANALGWVERKLWPRAPVILIYHRVIDPASDIWGISVAPERFAEQVEALQRVRRIVPLGELIQHVVEQKTADCPLAAITFDDGYYDVYATARPILERLDAPATVFVVSGMVGAAREFWWDELEFIFLGPHDLPDELETTLAGKPRRLGFPPNERGPRFGACHGFRAEFRDSGPDKIEATLASLRAWAGLERPARATTRAMTPEEIADLKDSPIRVGAHTVSHPAMPFLDLARQTAEVAESRRACEAWTGAPVPHFAYPFGRYDANSVAAARAAGFDFAVTTVPSVVRRGRDLLRLPRIAPDRMDGEALARALR